MKSIIIHLDNGESVRVRDDNSDELETYTLELSKVLESTNVITISTTEKNLILRPTRIDLIEVEEIKVPSEDEVCILRSEDAEKNEILKSATISEEEDDSEEDIIIDG